jgi:hypothetical protein
MKKFTPLMIVYSILAIAGFIVPWYFNIQHVSTGEKFTVETWLSAGMVSPLARSVTTDFFIGSTAVFIFMIVEGRRLKMKFLWAYILFTFLVAWAFTCPLFLFNRERILNSRKVNA